MMDSQYANLSGTAADFSRLQKKYLFYAETFLPVAVICEWTSLPFSQPMNFFPSSYFLKMSFWEEGVRQQHGGA